jgi:TolB-like protein
VCISEKVYDDIRNHPEIRATFLGEKSLKNVKRPIRVYALAANGRLNAATEPAVRVFDEHKERPRLRGGLLAAGLALLVVIASYPIVSRYVGGLKSAEHLPPASPTTVAVLPFSVSGGKDLGYLAEGMVTLLSTKLDGAAELRQVDPHSLLSFIKREGGWTPDPERGQQVAEHFGAGLYVLGSILDVSGRLHIEASIYDARKAADVAHATVEGDADRVLDLVDGLATELLAGRLTGPGERIARMSAMTTHSFPALKAFLEGETAFRAGRAT